MYSTHVVMRDERRKEERSTCTFTLITSANGIYFSFMHSLLSKFLTILVYIIIMSTTDV